MYDEYNALVKNGTWLLVPRTTDANMVRSMWLFKHKFHADGTLSRYKARLVANGSSQQLGVDFDETFIPVVKPATIRTVLALLCLLFAGYTTRTGFYHSRCDSSLFIYRQGSQVAYLLLYVDDIILAASSTTLLQHLIDSLHREFDMTDLGALNYFLGISAVCHSTGLFLSQRKYALHLLERAHMVNCNPSQTPVDTESKLGPDGVPVQDPTLYRRYFRFRPSLICILSTSLVGYTDADWAGCPSTRSAEAEYRGVANVVAETAWLRNLLRELHFPLSTATLVYCDNVRVLHVPSRFQYADIFTKGLPSALFEEFRSSLSVRLPPTPTAGAY
ncbi:ribonuclease H-like domain-containing protein [Tanacetum coccineum]